MAFLIFLFGAYALIDGVLAVVAGVKAAEHHERFGSLILRGILGVAAGLAAFILPAATAVVLTLMIGAWAVVTGVLEVVAAIHLHRAHGEWLLIANGVLSVLFGLFLVVVPALGILTLVWLIGTYAIVFGVIMLVLAFRLRLRHVRSALGILGEEPRIASKSRRLATPQDRGGSAHAEAGPSSATVTTASTSAAETTVMI